MKSTWNTFKTIVIVIAVIAGLFWMWQSGNLTYSFVTGELTIFGWTFSREAAPEPEPSPQHTEPVVDLPPAEDFPSGQGGDSTFRFVEKEGEEPLPPICSAFSNCDTNLANEFWATLPAEQAYQVPGLPVVVSGIEVIRSYKEIRSADPLIGTQKWWNDNYGNTFKGVIATGKFFARGALDFSKIITVVSAEGEIVIVVLKLPPMVLDSGGLAMASPQENQPWKPVELRIEPDLSLQPSPMYDSCTMGNFVACSANVSGNPIYDDINEQGTGMVQVAIQEIGILGYTAIDESMAFRQKYENAIFGAAESDPEGTLESTGQILTVGLDEYGNEVPQKVDELLRLLGEARGCQVMILAGRVCDTSKIQVKIQLAPWPEHFTFVDGTPFAVTQDQVANWATFVQGQ
jgi:hypothetical protein